jgi:outer membrane receptor for ferrienterochelin and colicins
MKNIHLIAFLLFCSLGFSQEFGTISGAITSENKAIRFVNVVLINKNFETQTDSLGNYKFENIPVGNYKIRISEMEFQPVTKSIVLKLNENLIVNFDLKIADNTLEEVVVSGTMKAVKRLESTIPVEVYSKTFLKKNPTPNVFEALQNVNGVRPQMNCGVCNTGDIHINGLEGPYTSILVDGMPVVSSLSTVYGLAGIPNSLIERIEIVKGPASTLYGSEAVAGLVNIITKKTQNVPLFAVDYFTTSWLENNIDLSGKFSLGEKVSSIVGLNYFKFGQRIDNDGDNFTDATLQDRISIFNKWNFECSNSRLFSVIVRGLYEDRNGGDLNWTKKDRGGNQIYGESIYTNRVELFGNYQLPTDEKLMLSFSGVAHFQDSRYGNTAYVANQKVVFLQLTWDKKIKNHNFLFGIANRYTFYDDNTAATSTFEGNNLPEKQNLPGIFAQDEIKINEKHDFILGMRYDNNSIHGNILTPRFGYRFKANENNIFRLNFGTGYRVVNLFTEDHAALNGSREVEIKASLRPEKSYNANFNYLTKLYSDNGTIINIEASAFYTKFIDKVFIDYETDPNKIIYDNINGYATSTGVSSNLDFSFKNGLKAIAGVTWMDVENVENNQKFRPFFVEKFTGTFAVSYKIEKLNLNFDYTGNVYSPMKLPLLGELDPRSPYSPWFSIQNTQLTFSGWRNFELYGGVKNLLNFTPKQNNPYLIARTNDPFDQNVQYDSNGNVQATLDNPYAATFDTAYVYTQNQGIRGFLGLRYTLK